MIRTFLTEIAAERGRAGVMLSRISGRAALTKLITPAVTKPSTSPMPR
jgi:hypothetical protein